MFASPFASELEAALLPDLPPGQYTVHAADKDGTSGLAVVELYDASPPGTDAALVNISNRGFCGVGGHVMIPGFWISDEGSKTLLIRVIGPGLERLWVTGVMADPKLAIYPAGAKTPIRENDNWSDEPNAGAVPAKCARLRSETERSRGVY